MNEWVNGNGEHDFDKKKINFMNFAVNTFLAVKAGCTVF